MKPLPEAVQRAFPCAPGRIPERPWWRHGVVSWGTKVVHRDDAPFQAQMYEHIVDRDTQHPLPHPGYRAGQVWAQEDGSSATICATYTHPNAHIICIGKAQFREETVARIYPFLMADPACPHLAPWSPSEEVKP